MNNILDYISEASSNDKFIYLNGLIDGKLYTTVFVPSQKEGHRPFVLLEDGSSIELELDKVSGHFFMREGQRYRFLNGPRLFCSPNLVNFPSAKAIKAVVEQAVPGKEELHQELMGVLNEFYDFYCPEECRIVAAQIIHTYLIGALGMTFFLLLEGEAGTGKSSLLKVMARLQYHGCFIAQATIPVLSRRLHCFQSTINVDEFDKSFNHNDGKSPALAFFNSGCYSGGTYEITNMNAKDLKNQIQVIQTFSAKAFSANKIYMDSTLSSRCVTIHTIRSKRRTKRIDRLSSEDDARINDLRDKIFTYCLVKGQSILAHIDQVQEELGEGKIFGRDSDILSIILGIEREFDQDGAVRTYLLEKRELDEDDNRDTDRAFIMYEFLLKKCSMAGNQIESVVFTNSELVDHINEALGFQDPDGADLPFHGRSNPYTATSSSVGKMLKLHKIITRTHEKRRITAGAGKGRNEYTIPKTKLLDILKRCSYQEIQQGVQELEEWLDDPGPNADTLPF